MSNISYHGTKQENAKSITGPPPNVDVSIGNGELGKGFYTGSSIALAAIWAQTRYGKEAVVIKFDIPEPKFVQLKGVVIKTKEEVKNGWKQLKANSSKIAFSSDHDYIIAPFATIEGSGHQLKFESSKAENELNSSTIEVFPCVS